MKQNAKRALAWGLAGLAAFAVWTVLVQTVDVRPIGEGGTDTGFAGWNEGFHRMTGVHMAICHLTDWLGLVPAAAGLFFAGFGFVQLVKRRSLRRVDHDILLLGVYDVLVLLCYVIFEAFPVNVRPILIGGVLEASYPSSTTLLVLTIMPSLVFQVNRRVDSRLIRTAVCTASVVFSLLMVVGRLICGVHWFTDVVGSVMLSMGLFRGYQAVVWLGDGRSANREG